MTCHAINCPFGATACHGCSCRGCFVLPSHDLPCNHLPGHSLPKLAMKCYVCSAIACPVFPCCEIPGCLTMACHACLLRDVFIVMPCKGQPCLHFLFITCHDSPSIARLWLAMHACLAMFTLPCLANLPVRLQQHHLSSYLRHETENTEQLWLAFTSPLIKSFVAASVILWFLWRTSSLAASNFSKNSEEKLFHLFLFSNVVPNTSLWILSVKRGGGAPKFQNSFHLRKFSLWENWEKRFLANIADWGQMLNTSHKC